MSPLNAFSVGKVKLKMRIFYVIRSEEKNLNQNRDSNLGPPDFESRFWFKFFS